MNENDQHLEITGNANKSILQVRGSNSHFEMISSEGRVCHLKICLLGYWLFYAG